MDSEPLVEQKAGGRWLIEQLVRDGFPVSAAFWVRTSEDSLWHLDIATPAIDEKPRNDAYVKVYESLDKMPSSWVTPVDLTLLSEKGPVARAVIELRDSFPDPLPSIYQGRHLRNLAIAEAYIYPKIEAPRLLYTVQYTRMESTNRWTAAVKRGKLVRGMNAQGAISYSTARWEGATAADPKFANVSVLVEIDPRFDRPEFLDHPDLRKMTARQARKAADEMFRSHHPDALLEHDRAEAGSEERTSSRNR